MCHTQGLLQPSLPQVTKSAATVNANTSPRDSKDGSPEQTQDEEGQEEQESGPEAPPVGTLLEFVAWVVLTGQAASYHQCRPTLVDPSHELHVLHVRCMLHIVARFKLQ